MANPSPVVVAFSVGILWGALIAAVVWFFTDRPRLPWLVIAGLAAIGGLIGGGLNAWLS